MEHIHKNVLRTGQKMQDVVKILSERYINFAGELTQKGFVVMIYGPAFSGYALNSYGTQKKEIEY